MFTSTVTDRPSGGAFGNLITSSLTFVANMSLNGINIQCEIDGSRIPRVNVTLLIYQVPSIHNNVCE